MKKLSGADCLSRMMRLSGLSVEDVAEIINEYNKNSSRHRVTPEKLRIWLEKGMPSRQQKEYLDVVRNVIAQNEGLSASPPSIELEIANWGDLNTRERVIKLIAMSGLPINKVAEVICKISRRPCSWRSVQSWISDPSVKSHRRCPEWVVPILLSHLGYKNNNSIQ